jgi:hypothetical protein
VTTSRLPELCYALPSIEHQISNKWQREMLLASSHRSSKALFTSQYTQFPTSFVALPLFLPGGLYVAVGIATGFGRGSSPGRRKGFLLSTSIPVPRPTQWIPGSLSFGVKRPGREVDHSPLTSAEVKKTWIYISTPPYAFMM